MRRTLELAELWYGKKNTPEFALGNARAYILRCQIGFQSPAKPFEAVRQDRVWAETSSRGSILIISTTNFWNVLHYHDDTLRKVYVCSSPLSFIVSATTPMPRHPTGFGGATGDSHHAVAPACPWHRVHR